MSYVEPWIDDDDPWDMPTPCAGCGRIVEFDDMWPDDWGELVCVTCRHERDDA